MSDEAIEALRKSKENPFRHFAYDKIIADKEILPIITQYLFAFLEYERLQSQYRAVPVNGVSDGYADHKMIRLITWLPMWKRNMIRILKRQQRPMFDRLLLEYVASVADELACSDMVGEFQDDYDGEMFDPVIGTPGWFKDLGKEEREQWLAEEQDWEAQVDTMTEGELSQEQELRDTVGNILKHRRKEK